MPNYNPKTGIPYGVISMNSLAYWVWEELVYNGVNETYEKCAKEPDFMQCYDLPTDWYDQDLA